MRKTGLTLPALAALAVCLSACASTPSSSAGSAYGGSTATSAAGPTASSGSTAMTSQPKTAMLTIRKTKIGYVLANAQGYTLYWYSKDVKGSGSSTCTGQCLTTWPALAGKPAAVSGIKLNGILGTITRPGGTIQATYNGYPLYLYAGDSGPGAVTGNDIGGVWHVITGDVLTSSVPRGSSGSSGSGRSSGSGSSGSGSGGSGSGGSGGSGGYGY
jgi:predicted lipoprotein with Yx(FWY)xxD motif